MQGGFGLGTRHDLMALRHASSMSPFERLNCQVRRDEVLHHLDAIDDELRRLASERREALAELKSLRERLWPRVRKAHARRPPIHGLPPLPPLVANPIPVYGVGLRHLALAILEHRGPMTLTEIHAAIHLSGYMVDSEHAVKALADALGYATRKGHAERVRRGTYQTGTSWPRRGRRRPPRSASPYDPIIAWDPAEWPLPHEETKADTAPGVVQVEVDKHDRLPGAEQWLPRNHGHHDGWAHDCGQHVVGPMPDGTVPMVVAAISGKEAIQCLSEIGLGARTRFDQGNTGCRVRDKTFRSPSPLFRQNARMKPETSTNRDVDVSTSSSVRSTS